jgi:LPXTG-motif cell wall-anchored protein
LDEIDDRIAELRSFFLVTVSLFSALLLLSVGYLLLRLGFTEPVLPITIAGAAMLLFAFLVRKKRQKEYIKTQLLGITEDE